ncbi:hypothetical protein QUB47_06970 [Microcoleus sp. AT9_B5]
MPTRSALCSSSLLFAVAQLHGAIRDRNTQYQYFKNTSRAIALEFGALAKPSKRIALLVSSLIILRRVRYLSRAIARSQLLMRSGCYRQKT